jgi:hypothetical protein
VLVVATRKSIESNTPFSQYRFCCAVRGMGQSQSNVSSVDEEPAQGSGVTLAPELEGTVNAI